MPRNIAAPAPGPPPRQSILQGRLRDEAVEAIMFCCSIFLFDTIPRAFGLVPRLFFVRICARRNNYGTSEVVVQTTESLEQLSHN